MPNSVSTWSSICRCWPVTQTLDMIPAVAARRRKIGAILIASRRVPNTVKMCIQVGFPRGSGRRAGELVVGQGLHIGSEYLLYIVLR